MFKGIFAALVVSAAIFLTLIALAYGWQSFWGGRGVEALCAKDGGLRIEKTMAADGFLYDLPDQESGCLYCVEYLIKFNFVFVDINVQAPSEQSDTSLPEVGYYRMSLSTEGDPRCDAWLEDAEAQRGRNWLSRIGLLPSQCVVIKKLPERPPGAVLDEEIKGIAVTGGQEVKLRERRLRVEPTGETLARIRGYTYASKWQKYLDESGGGGGAQYRCSYPYSPTTLNEFMRVLQPRPIGATQSGER
jgi:hypothetical protein